MPLADVVGGPPIQDYIVLAGMRSPGRVIVKGASAPRKWDTAPAYGLSGSSSIYIGSEVAKFDVEIACWEPEHFVAWEVFARATLQEPTAFGPSALSMSIQHPQLNDAPLKIKQVVVTNVTQWDQPDDDGLWVRTISFLEFRQRKQAIVKAFEGPPGSPVNVPAPVDPELQLIAAGTVTIAGLVGP